MAPNTQKPNIVCIQNQNQTHQDDIQTFPHQQPLPQPCQEGHPNVQGPHGQRTQRMLAHHAYASWSQLLPQIECQLLLLCQLKVYPNILANAHLYGHHNYNHHPFVPIGVEALVHDCPHNRRLFAQHCRKVFVLGISTKHYRCWKFWLVTTRATRILGAAFFKHKYLTNTTVTPEDRVIAVAGPLA
jgi:hypothetical protein